MAETGFEFRQSSVTSGLTPPPPLPPITQEEQPAPQESLLPRHTGTSPPPHGPAWRPLTFWKVRASRACVCRPHAASSWASQSHSVHRGARGPPRNSCRRPSAMAAATARRLCTQCRHALKHLDGHCRLGTDQADQGMGLVPSPGESGGLSSTHVAFPAGRLHAAAGELAGPRENFPLWGASLGNPRQESSWGQENERRTASQV